LLEEFNGTVFIYHYLLLKFVIWLNKDTRDHGDIRLFSFHKKDVKTDPVLKNQAVLIYGEEFTELNTTLTFP
jgi:hypothetical protein